jgi:glycine hydroxymethyltransferase
MRFGSPAVTTRGFREPEIREVARLIAHVLDNIQSQEAITEARRAVRVLTDRFPLYAWKLTPAAFR